MPDVQMARGTEIPATKVTISELKSALYGFTTNQSLVQSPRPPKLNTHQTGAVGMPSTVVNQRVETPGMYDPILSGLRVTQSIAVEDLLPPVNTSGTGHPEVSSACIIYSFVC